MTWLPCCSYEPIALADDRCVHPVARLGQSTTCGDHIEVEMMHGGKITSA